VIGNDVWIARVSTKDQNLSRQLDMLEDCSEIFVGKISGTKSNRPELNRLIGKLRAGDIAALASSNYCG